jgi:cytochrome oxidase assembly protein ShyY1
MTTDIRRRGTRAFAAFTAVMIAIFVGLGVWQLQRRAEKHALIAALDARVSIAPVALPPPSQWRTLDAVHDEFRRVSFTATYAKLPDAMVYSAGSAVREDVSGPGTWAFLPARLASGETVVIEAGFVPNTMQQREIEDHAVSKLVTGEPVTFTGYLRFPESAGLLTPADNRNARLWFTRDHLAMAKTLGWAQGEYGVAPFYIDLETPVPDNGIPKPGPLTPHLRDEHMQYAITWFSLAAALVIAFGVWARGRRAQAPSDGSMPYG